MAAKKPVMSPTDVDVDHFIAHVSNDQRRADAEQLVELMSEITGEKATMWGPSIIGFGSYHYVYESGHEGDAPVAGFSPRSQALAVYLVAGYEERYAAQLARLGPHKTAKACLYIKRLSDVDLTVLSGLIEHSMRVARKADRPRR